MNIKNPNSDKVHLTWTNLIINTKVKHSCLSSKYRFQHLRSKRIEEGCQLRQYVFVSFGLSNFDNKVKLDGHFRYIWESWFSLIIINDSKDPFTDYETINFCWPFDIPSTFGSSSPSSFYVGQSNLNLTAEIPRSWFLTECLKIFRIREECNVTFSSCISKTI